MSPSFVKKGATSFIDLSYPAKTTQKQRKMKKNAFFRKFSSEMFGDSKKSRTFASQSKNKGLQNKTW